MNTESKKMDASRSSNASTESSLNSKQREHLEYKWRRILRAITFGTLNRFEAERHGDHCLNSTIAELGRDHLVAVDWVWEDVPAIGGRTTARVKRYWVERTEESLRRARDLLQLA